MDTSSGYKDRALSSLNGNWGNGAIACLVTYLIMLAPSYGIVAVIPGDPIWGNLSNLWSIAMLPLAWGLAIFFLTIARGQKADIGQLFDGFKDYWHIFATMFLRQIFTTLWTLLFIIPGIIKYYSYSMTDYILKDEPEVGANEAIEKSMAMMEGHKMDLFLLHLSFIGWAILAMCTLGLGFLLLIPYVCTAEAHFYEDLKAERLVKEEY